MAEYIIVRLASVYDSECPCVVGMSIKTLREAGFVDFEELLSKLENSTPSGRAVKDYRIPGCNQEGELIQEEKDAPEEEQRDPGHFGLRWTKFEEGLAVLTREHWCVVTNAYYDE